MARIRHSAEQIINKLREAEVLLGQGMKVPEVTRQLGVTAQTYFRWRKEYGGLKTDQAKKLKDLERENARLADVQAILNAYSDLKRSGWTDRGQGLIVKDCHPDELELRLESS